MDEIRRRAVEEAQILGLYYCKTHNMYYGLLGNLNYLHLRVGVKGITVYEGAWADNECSTSALVVKRDRYGHPSVFYSLEEAVTHLEKRNLPADKIFKDLVG